MIGGLIWWRFQAPQVARMVWLAAGVITVIYYAVPPVRGLVLRTWMYAAFPIGWVISEVLLGLIFYLAFTPMGLVLRLLGHDPLQRRSDAKQRSYWIAHDPGGDMARYFKQF